MRQASLALCGLSVFVVSFAVIYISFRTSTPQVRGLVGGGFFLLAALLLLWRDFAPSILPKRVAGVSQSGGPPPQEPSSFWDSRSQFCTSEGGRIAAQMPANEFRSQELFIERRVNGRENRGELHVRS
jgi:hypothetical protein